jgi:transcriptional regulator with XRE-family HTH domain
VGTHERRSDRAAERSRRLRISIGTEVRLARQRAGLSLRVVAAAVRCSPSTLSRLERGLLGTVTVDLLVHVGIAVGLDVTVRAYPGGEPLRDSPQFALLEMLRRRVHASLRWAFEVGLPIPGDQRRWDAVVAGPTWGVAVEAEATPRDWQALIG